MRRILLHAGCVVVCKDHTAIFTLTLLSLCNGDNICYVNLLRKLRKLGRPRYVVREMATLLVSKCVRLCADGIYSAIIPFRASAGVKYAAVLPGGWIVAFPITAAVPGASVKSLDLTHLLAIFELKYVHRDYG